LGQILAFAFDYLWDFHSYERKMTEKAVKKAETTETSVKAASEVEQTQETKPQEIKPKNPTGGANAFWAVVLVSIGIIFLLNNFGLVPWEVWANIWRFWPVVLILWGVQLVFGRNWFSNLLVAVLGLGLVLAILVVSVASVNEDFDSWSAGNIPFWMQIRGTVQNADHEVTTEIVVADSRNEKLNWTLEPRDFLLNKKRVTISSKFSPVILKLRAGRKLMSHSKIMFFFLILELFPKDPVSSFQWVEENMISPWGETLYQPLSS
jgi:hypothetical protein